MLLHTLQSFQDCSSSSRTLSKYSVIIGLTEKKPYHHHKVTGATLFYTSGITSLFLLVSVLKTTQRVISNSKWCVRSDSNGLWFLCKGVTALRDTTPTSPLTHKWSLCKESNLAISLFRRAQSPDLLHRVLK